MAKHDRINLLINILGGTATEPEKLEFENWCDQSENNRLFYKQVEAIWLRLSKNYDNVSFDKSIAREKIIAKIQQKSQAKIHRYRFWLSAAASVLLLIGSALIFFLNSDSREKNLTSYQTSANEINEFYLSDSTEVWLNRNSKLLLDKNFNKKQRKVFLEGEAFFNVTRNEEKEFKVLTGKTITKILGTSFHLMLKEDGKVNLGVNSGKVEFFHKYQMAKHLVLIRGENAAYNPETNEVKQLIKSDKNALSWKTGILVFDNTPFEKVCKALSRHYNIPIRSMLKDKNLSLTGTFNREDLDDVLTTLSLTLEINYAYKDGEIILYK